MEFNIVISQIKSPLYANKAFWVIFQHHTQEHTSTLFNAEQAYAMVAKFKLILLGDAGVGKTSLLARFMYDTFDSTYAATIGIDFLSKTMHVQDTTIRLQLWDTAGQERFRSLVPSYIRDSHVAVVVYDVSSKASFDSVATWAEYVRRERGQQAVLVLVGNKNDLDDQREVSLQQGEDMAAKLGCALFMETSSKNGFGVKSLFKRIAKKLPVFATQEAANQQDEQAGEEQTIDVSVQDKNQQDLNNCAC